MVRCTETGALAERTGERRNSVLHILTLYDICMESVSKHLELKKKGLGQKIDVYRLFHTG